MMRSHAYRWITVLTVAWLPFAKTHAAPAISQTGEAADAPTVVTLTVDPAAAPVPAMKYRLRIHYLDQTPGNAALQYYTAITLYQQASKPEDADKIAEWLDLPPAKLPVDAVREVLGRYQTTLMQAGLAAKYEHCDWEYPVRTRGMDTLLPGLAPYRTIAKLAALRARFEISQNQLEPALEDLQTGFAMARHACDSPVLISDLIGYAIAKLMSQQVIAWVQAPNAANLYWALADLPSPFKDPRQLLGGEEGFLYFSFPSLREVNPKLSSEQWNRMARDLEKLLNMGGQDDGEWSSKLSAAATLLKLYPQAKKDLISSGHDPKEVEAMPAQQAVIMAGYEAYIRQRDEMFKWFSVPYWQARPGLAEAERRLGELCNRTTGYPFMRLLPALNRAYYTTTRLDRDLAALRCIEAIRMYAAANGGQLPSSLGEIKAVPLPIDPITGKEFPYKVEAGQGILVAPRPEGEKAREEIHYIVTVRKP